MKADTIKKEIDAIFEEKPFIHLQDAIYEALYRKIIRLEYEPGCVLAEVRLAKELESSRTPIRNALQMLAGDGLVVRNDGRSFRVASLKKDECRQLMEVRVPVEGQAAYWAAERIEPEQLDALQNNYLGFKRACLDWDIEGLVNYDHAFHQIVVDAAKNEFISEIYSQIKPRILHYRYFLYRMAPMEILEPIMTASTRHHMGMLNAIQLGLSNEARERMQSDVSGMGDIIGVWNAAYEKNALRKK